MNRFAGCETTNFLIRRAARGIRVDESQLNRMLQYLGGVHTPTGFAFATDRRRQVAWEVLCERFGSRYFEKHDEIVAGSSSA